MNKKLIDSKLNFKIILFIILLFLLFFNSITHGVQNKILFKVNKQIVTSIDILDEINYLILMNKDFKKFNKEQIVEIAKNSIIKEKIKEIELNNKNINPQFDNTTFEQIVINYFKSPEINSIENLKEILKKNNLQFEKIKKKLSTEFLWNRLIFEKFSKNVKINRSLIEKEINKKKIQTEFLLSEIVFNLDKKKDLNKKYEEIKKIIETDNFSKAALIFSISDSSNNSGKIGWINENSISNKIREEISKNKIGQITNPIQIPGGFIILKLEDKREVKVGVEIEKEIEKVVIKKTNEQLEQFSNIYFQKIKKNIKINEL